MGKNNEIEFRIINRVGVIAEYPTGWNKELNVVSWNKGIPKFDLRDWSEDHEHMSRGITMHEAEIKTLMGVIGEYFENLNIEERKSS